MPKKQFCAMVVPMYTLTATKRSKADKLADVRSNGMVPAVVYGARVENTMISVPSVEFKKVLKEAGETSTVELMLEGKKIDVLIHDVQVDPIRGFAIHADFLAVDMNKKAEVVVGLEFTGVAPAEKAGLGTLVKVLHEITIEALPKDLPHSVTVDISSLATLEDRILAGNIKLPAGVSLVSNTEDVVALVATVKEEKEEAPVDLSAIEVEKRGKKEEEAPADK